MNKRQHDGGRQLDVRVAHKRSRQDSVKLYVDVTSKSLDEQHRLLSPFYCPEDPHSLLVLGDGALVCRSVEGAWQGLKVFENEGAAMAMLTSSKPKKRNAGVKRGAILGHLLPPGVPLPDGVLPDPTTKLLGYVEARKALYIPLYNQVLQREDATVQALADQVADRGRGLVLLDYDVNGDVEDPRKPLSHASLVAARVREKLAQP